MSTVRADGGEQLVKGSDEDVRASVGIQVTIGTMVMTAGLAVLAAEAGLITFYLEQRTLQGWAVFLLVLAALLVVAGFICGGNALNRMSVDGYSGRWDIGKVSGLFNIQAVFTLIAAVLVLSGVIGGSSPAETASKKMAVLKASVQRDELKIRRLQREVTILGRSVKRLQRSANR